MSISTHVCRGNYHSTYGTSGGYEPVAESLFVKENVEIYFLEFDDECSGNFELLRFVPKNKKVVLGLVTSKKPQLEDKEEVKKRIEEAAKYVDLEHLSLSPQCGFASIEEGSIFAEEDQWKKMQLVQEISKEEKGITPFLYYRKSGIGQYFLFLIFFECDSFFIFSYLLLNSNRY